VEVEDREWQFLIVEFETAWRSVLRIDDRRGIFFRYYNLIFVAVLGVSGSMLKDWGMPSVEKRVAISALLLFAALSGQLLKQVLQSEREANIRYRKKINLIREVCLGGSQSAEIQEYLRHKELGIKLLVDADQPAGDGTTLRSIYLLINLEMGFLLLMTLTLWLLSCF